VDRCRKINGALNGECCTFYTLFSPFNVVRERPVFTEEALAGRSWDETLMAHLREDESAVVGAMHVIGRDMAHLARLVLTEGGCDGIYQSVQGAEHGRMTNEEYDRMIRPTEIPILEAANKISPYNILHLCSWAGNPNQLNFWQDYPCRVKNWGVGIEGLTLRQGLDFFPGSILMGGMDNRKDHPLYGGTKESIQQAARAVLDEMNGVPFILGADCTIPPDVDWQHFRWLVEEVQK
jgi:uroporphyrinogen decarboxylase